MRLFIIGRGATAERIAELGGQLGYEELRLVDELPSDLAATDHLVIGEDDARRGRELLLAAVRRDELPAYVGYAAPHREGWKALVALAAAGIAKARLDAISAPAGVDVGAETPEEVAIAVAAELVALRRGRPRPSAGIPIEKAPAGQLRPRRVLGRFGRPDDPDDDGGGEGRN